MSIEAECNDCRATINISEEVFCDDCHTNRLQEISDLQDEAKSLEDKVSELESRLSEYE